METVGLFNSYTGIWSFKLHILNVARGLGSMVKYSRLLTTDCEFDPLSHQLNIFKGGMYWFFPVWRNMLPYTELGLSCVVDAPVHRAWFVMCGGRSRTPSLVCHVWWTLPYTELGLSCVVDAPVHRAWFVRCGGRYRTPSLVCHVWWMLPYTELGLSCVVDAP